MPGRVELVGKHVDYAGGRSLTCAVDRAITATVTELAEPVIRVRDEGKRGYSRCRSSPASSHAGGKRRGTYVVAVARRFARDFPRARTGVDVTLRSTLPPSAGLSSSSALVVAIASALVAANPMDGDDAWSVIFGDPLARAEYFGAMETGAPFGHSPATTASARVAARRITSRSSARATATSDSSRTCRRGSSGTCPAGGVRHRHRRERRARDEDGNARARYNRVSDSARALLRSWNAATARVDVTLADALASDAGRRRATRAARGDGSGGVRWPLPRAALRPVP